ncbi:MAG: Vitamin B12 dependent methionine synthase activation subunit [Clostridia bacterium]|nr:Vitamin B12 dependent methionine synthase activation subunit [Clostridia bacterium]
MTEGDFIREETFSEPEISRREIIRYAGGGEDSGEFSALIDSCLAEALPMLSYKVCYRSFSYAETEQGLDFGFAKVKSEALSKNLRGCDKILLFAATVGIGIDRLIMKYGRISPARALIMQALGAERIEALCDAFCSELENKGLAPRPRFSPGYGDLPLEFQKDIFAALDCHRKIGLTLSSSLLMSPTKSVTAIVGIEK